MFEMTNSNKSVFIDRNTSHIKHGWQEKRMIMQYNACVSCELIGHNFPTVLQHILTNCSCFNHINILFWNISGTYLGEKFNKYVHNLDCCLWHWPALATEWNNVIFPVWLEVWKLTFQWHKSVILCSHSHPNKSLKCIQFDKKNF